MYKNPDKNFIRAYSKFSFLFYPTTFGTSLREEAHNRANDT